MSETLNHGKHVHIEGLLNLQNEKLWQLLLKYITSLNQLSPQKQDFFKKRLGFEREPCNLNVLTRLRNAEPINIRAFDFDAFLQKLLLAKLILTASPQSAAEFFDIVLTNFNGDLGFTPTIPTDFNFTPEEQTEWNSAIVKKIKAHHVRIGRFVIEVKRQHYNDSKALTQAKAFAKLLKEECPDMQIDIGLCDNEVEYPIYENGRLGILRELIGGSDSKDRPIFNGATLHILEFPHEADRVAKALGLDASNVTGLEELEQILTLKIENLRIVHGYYIMGGIDPTKNFKDMNALEKTKFIKGLAMLKELGRKRIPIILCYLSCKKIKAKETNATKPFLLEYPEVLKTWLNNEITFKFGTDDPYAWGGSTLKEEVQLMLAELRTFYTANHPDVEVDWEKVKRIIEQS